MRNRQVNQLSLSVFSNRSLDTIFFFFILLLIYIILRLHIIFVALKPASKFVCNQQTVEWLQQTNTFTRNNNKKNPAHLIGVVSASAAYQSNSRFLVHLSQSH